MVDRNELFESLKAWILQLPGVTQAAHRFGGTEFQVEGLEFMHHHGPSFLDIRLSKSDLKLPRDSSGSHMKTQGPAWKPTVLEETK